MQIEIRGSEDMLDEIRMIFQDLLEKAGYGEGPRVGSMDTGALIGYTKGDAIISLQATEESEAGDCIFRVEAEQEIPELYQLWDEALITYGKKIKLQLIDFAVDKSKVEKGIR